MVETLPETERAVEAFLAMLSAENGVSLSADTDVRVEIERGPYIVALTNQGKEYLEVYDISDGKLLWYTEAAASNPHSIELMPNGVIAIVSSSGGEVRFFTTDKKTSRTAAAMEIDYSFDYGKSDPVAFRSV